jgi:E3 ubiquitin-protein ligase RNF115/126
MYAEEVDDNDSMPGLEDAHSHLDPRHNPWATDDPDEEDISNVRFTQTAPGRLHINATITRSISPEQFRAGGGAGMAQGPIGGFMSMLNGLTRNAAQQGQQPQGQAGPNQNQNQSAFQEARGQGQDGQPRVSRFTYTSGAQMNPDQENLTK